MNVKQTIKDVLELMLRNEYFILVLDDDTLGFYKALDEFVLSGTTGQRVWKFKNHLGNYGGNIFRSYRPHVLTKLGEPYEEFNGTDLNMGYKTIDIRTSPEEAALVLETAALMIEAYTGL